MSEGKEGQNLSQDNKKFIEVEAPERLEPGQNLYDQAPFLFLVQRICESTGKTRDQVHTNISYFAKIHFARTLKDPNLPATELIKEVDGQPPAVRLSYDDKLKMLRTLQMHPYLSKYIVLQRQNQLYKSNGNYRKDIHAKTEPPALRYANWVIHEVKHEKDSWVVGIEEIFPKDVGHPVTSLPNTTGVKPATGRFRTLKAANIATDK